VESVKANHEAGGIDGESIEAFGETLEERLSRLRSSEQRRQQQVEPNKDQPICRAQPVPGGSRPRRDERLRAEKYYFKRRGTARDLNSPTRNPPSSLKRLLVPPSGTSHR
jgi:hypothetical protein